MASQRLRNHNRRAAQAQLWHTSARSDIHDTCFQNKYSPLDRCEEPQHNDLRSTDSPHTKHVRISTTLHPRDGRGPQKPYLKPPVWRTEGMLLLTSDEDCKLRKGRSFYYSNHGTRKRQQRWEDSQVMENEGETEET